MIPYLPSLSWYANISEGIVTIPPKRRWNRTLLSDEIMLSIPVEGGVTMVKRGDPERWIADDTRPWRREHVGAVNALFGRTPFFGHYLLPVLDIIADTSISRVAEINNAIFQVWQRLLPAQRLLEEFRQFDTERQRELYRYAAQLAAAPRLELSMINYLCLYGPDTIFVIIKALEDIRKSRNNSPK